MFLTSQCNIFEYLTPQFKIIYSTSYVNISFPMYIQNAKQTSNYNLKGFTKGV